VPLLLATGQRLRVVTRKAAKVAALDARVERVAGDLHDRETVARAVAGAERIFMVSIIADVSHEADRMLVEEARRAGVRHIVKISSIGAGRGRIGILHGEKDRLVEESGIPWTFLRPGHFMSNALGWAATIKSGATVFAATGDGKTAPISPRDIAAVVALTLTTPGHHGKAYVLTGAELLSAPEEVRILSRVLGKPIACVDISIDTAAANLRKSGAPDWLVEGLSDLWRETLAGKGATRTGEVERLTGQMPQSFEAWCQDHRTAFG